MSFLHSKAKCNLHNATTGTSTPQFAVSPFLFCLLWFSILASYITCFQESLSLSLTVQQN